jgi:hypothetical protein
MKKIATMYLILSCLVYAATAQATLITYNDRTSFNSQGSIVYNYGFEDFTGSTFYYPDDPWTSHGVTYATADNIIAGPTSWYGNSSNVFINNWWTPLTATISPTFNMFAFDLGILGGNSPVNLELVTNQATYYFNNLNVSNVSQGLDFYGFSVSSGEYFTAFTLSSVYGSGYAPAIDNVTLGNSAAPVPEPSTLLLFGAGLFGIVFLRKRMRT